MFVRNFLLGLLLVLSGVIPVHATTDAQWESDPPARLTAGDPAPAFKPAKWLKGAPVDHFEPDRFYVIEFWNTWTGPSPQIMNSLQKQYPDIIFIGVHCCEDMVASAHETSAWVDKMDYRVAEDTQPARDVARQWIPHSFDQSQLFVTTYVFVDKTGHIAGGAVPDSLDWALETALGPRDAAREAKYSEFMKARLTARNADSLYEDLVSEFPEKLGTNSTNLLREAFSHRDVPRVEKYASLVAKSFKGRIGFFQERFPAWMVPFFESAAAGTFDMNVEIANHELRQKMETASRAADPDAVLALGKEYAAAFPERSRLVSPLMLEAALHKKDFAAANKYAAIVTATFRSPQQAAHSNVKLWNVMTSVFRGSFDAKLAARQLELDDEVNDAQRASDWDRYLTVCDEYVRLFPSHADRFNNGRLSAAIAKKDYALANRMIRRLADDSFDDGWALSATVWQMVYPDRVPDSDLDLLLKMAKRAVKLSGSSSEHILRTAARVYFLKGDLAMAARQQAAALSILMKRKPAPESDIREYNAALNIYMNAMATTRPAQAP